MLTARGFFEATPEQEEDMVESMQPEAPKTPPSADDLKFLAFWKAFVVSLKEPKEELNLRKIIRTRKRLQIQQLEGVLNYLRAVGYNFRTGLQ